MTWLEAPLSDVQTFALALVVILTLLYLGNR